jgi:cytoskeletal protein CcmA (bactofilin family)
MAIGQNLVINGSGSYPGGKYDKVVIRGEGTIVHDLEGSVFKTYGTSEMAANVKADSMRVFGEAEIQGCLSSKKCLVMGTMSIKGKAEVKELKIRGMMDAGPHLNGEKADIKGSLAVNGDVEFDSFSSIGSFEIKGLLSADTINVRLRHSHSTAEEIGGGKIIVKRKSLLIPFIKDEGHLAAKVIEGDHIYLENTEAQIVRGNVVEIGPGCTIGQVEYFDSFSQDKDSTVKVKTKRGIQ